MVTVYLALGGNVGDREANLAAALNALTSAVQLQAVSAVYETEPVGYADQPWFLNVVCRGQTDLSPRELLRLAKRIEAELGRKPTFRNGPRPVDVDILFYGDLALSEPDLVIPHPRLTERAFVLFPLADLAPDLLHPELNRSIQELANALTDHEQIRPHQPAGWWKQQA